jgi:sugar lactone lactonase YvrE
MPEAFRAEAASDAEASGFTGCVHPAEALMRKTMSLALPCVLIGMICWGCGGIQQQGKSILAIKLNTDTAFAGAEAKEVPGTGAKKAITPAAAWTPSTFTIAGAGPGGAVFEIESAAKNAEVRIIPGEWLISAKGFAAGGTQVAAGSSACTLQAGRTTAVSLVLYPLAGAGNLEITVSMSLVPAAGARLAGELVYCGLPGSQPPAERTARPIDAPAEQPAISFAGIEAGHYALSLRLIDSDGVVSGGSADSVVVAAGFTTSGTCAIELGTPTAELSTDVFSNEPLPPPLLSVSHRIAASKCPMPLAISRASAEGGESIEARWYLNGVSAGEGIAAADGSGILPEGIVAFPQSASPPPVSLMRADLVEEAAVSLRTGSASSTLIAASAPGDAEVGWKGSYDFQAAIDGSLYDAGANGAGKGYAYMAKAVAASPSGLVAVSGLDEEGAIHVFAACYGAPLQTATPSGAIVLPLDTSWIRLWRDRIKVNGTVKSADKLAISPDGRYIAAASTLSTWIAVYELGDHGRPGTCKSFQASTPETTDFGNIKGLCFSPDSARLYAASNKDGRVYAFNMGSEQLSVAGSCLPWTREGAESYDFQAIETTVSGAVVITSDERSRIAIFPDGEDLAAPAILQGAYNVGEPFHPSALAIAPDGDAFYVLCGGNRVLRYDRAENGYTLTSTLALGTEAKDASCLAAGAGWAGSRPMIAVAGGAAMVIYEPDPDPDLVPDTTVAHVCAPDVGDSMGIASPSGLCFARGAFFLSSEAAKCVSVFGGEP